MIALPLDGNCAGTSMTLDEWFRIPAEQRKRISRRDLDPRDPFDKALLGSPHTQAADVLWDKGAMATIYRLEQERICLREPLRPEYVPTNRDSVFESPWLCTYGWRENPLPEARVPWLQWMEWVSGDSLLQWSKVASRKPADFRSMARSIETMVIGLQRDGLVHGDLHPGNVIVSKGQRPMLVDYDSLDCFPEPGTIASTLGLPGYHHPRTARGIGRTIDYTADSFAAVVLIVELELSAHRRQPVPADADHFLALGPSSLEAPDPWHREAAAGDERLREAADLLRSLLESEPRNSLQRLERMLRPIRPIEPATPLPMSALRFDFVEALNGNV
jgi:hypothetical protein